jgi:predicted RNA-binding protein with PIN domain
VPILVDGHNLIGRLATPSLEDADDESELVRMLGSYRARRGKSITVVFDPGGAFALPQARHFRGIDIVFAPHGSSADAVIIRLVRKSRDRHRWLVITSDRDLAGTVRDLGARVQSAEAFARLLDPPEPEGDAPPWKEATLSADELDEWLDLFEGDDAASQGTEEKQGKL